MKNSFQIAIAGLVILFLFLGCGSQNKNLSKGKEWVKSNKRHREERAVERFKLAIKEEPENAEAHYLLGYYDEKIPVDSRGEHMYKAYQYDAKKYLEILVFETLRDREPSVREAALDALKRIYATSDSDKKRAMKQLKKAIESKDSRDRHDAQWVLAELGRSQSGANRA